MSIERVIQTVDGTTTDSWWSPHLERWRAWVWTGAFDCTTGRLASGPTREAAIAAATSLLTSVTERTTVRL